MILTVLKTLWSCIWVLLKPCLFVLIPFSIVFGIAFYVAYLRKKKSGTAHREVIAHFNPKNDVSILQNYLYSFLVSFGKIIIILK